MPARTGVALLDVNVLLALAWPNHTHNGIARAWFSEHARRGWATTPVTEIGFVRVSSDRRAFPTTTSPARATEMLARLTTLPEHQFWPDSIGLVTAAQVDLGQLTGHRQITDAHLLALCRDRGGRLATFDRAVATLALDRPDSVVTLGPDERQNPR